jgi:hypothetical protein
MRQAHRMAITGLARWALTFASGLLVACALGACTQDDGVRQDSLVALLARPTAYEGRVVTLRGYVDLTSNATALYLHEDDYRWGLEANGVWLHMPRCANRAGQGVTRGYMTVVGNFTTRLHGFANGWVGEIDNITLCRLIEGTDAEPRPRP